MTGGGYGSRRVFENDTVTELSGVDRMRRSGPIFFNRNNLKIN